MTSVTYGKRNLWQLMATYDKDIMASVIMAKIFWQMKLSPNLQIEPQLKIEIQCECFLLP